MSKSSVTPDTDQRKTQNWCIITLHVEMGGWVGGWGRADNVLTCIQGSKDQNKSAAISTIILNVQVSTITTVTVAAT